MKVNDSFNMDKCLDTLKNHFKDCTFEKKSGVMGEFIDIKKTSLVGSRIIYQKNKGKLDIGSRPSILSTFFGIFSSLSTMSFVSDIEEILSSNFESKN